MEEPQPVTPPRRARLAGVAMDRAARQDVIMSQAEQDRPPVLWAARERTRAEITRQILDTARRHLATEGAPGRSLRAIVREPGGSPPAVYRYVAESVRRWAEQLGRPGADDRQVIDLW
jgi:hypothetical protein